MIKFLLWCILLVLCWPVALLALILYPLVWVLLLPFRILGIAVGGVLQLVWAIVTLPARILGGPRRAWRNARQETGTFAPHYPLYRVRGKGDD